MFAKTAFFILFLCFFMHASTTPSSALPNPISHHFQKIGEKIKFKKFGSNGRVTLVHSMPTQSSTENLSNKINAIKGGTNRTNCKSSPHKALLQVTKSKESRLPDLNVREMDLKHSSIFSEEDLSETTDYQPPHRKSPIHNK